MAAELHQSIRGGPMKRRMYRHPVVQPPDQSYRLIPLTRNQNAIVDVEDFEWLNQWNWHATWCSDTKSFYAHSEVEENMLAMHRVILGCGPREQGDHKNRNTLDNRRSNLRKCTHQQNHFNARRFNKTGYKGVVKLHGKWRARITIDGRRRHLGYYNSAEEAARAYDRAAIELHGEFANLNFLPVNSR